MVEFAQKCLGIYAKYVRDPEREDLFSNLCRMKFDDFMLRQSRTSITSSNMSRAESEESATHRDMTNMTVVTDIEDQAKIPDDAVPNDTETDDQEKKVPDKTLSSEEEKFLAEFQHSYGDTSPVPNSCTEDDATPIIGDLIITAPISVPTSDEEQPLGGGDGEDVLREGENYSSVQYGSGHNNPMFQHGQMVPPMMAYPQAYPVWPHPFPYPPWFMPMHPMMMPAMSPYYQGSHTPLEDQMKETSFEEVEDDQPSGSSSDTASPSINSQTELTESANEKERDMPESDSMLLDKSLPSDTEKATPTEKLSDIEDGKTPGRMQLGNRKFYHYNNNYQHNRGGYPQRYYLGNPRPPQPQQQQQQWYDNNRGGFNRRRRTREHENK